MQVENVNENPGKWCNLRMRKKLICVLASFSEPLGKWQNLITRRTLFGFQLDTTVNREQLVSLLEEFILLLLRRRCLLIAT